jgi:hypothetical protein
MIDLDELEKLALDASKGEWRYASPTETFGMVYESGRQIADCCTDNAVSTEECRANGKFISAANPATILELIRMVREKK